MTRVLAMISAAWLLAAAAPKPGPWQGGACAWGKQKALNGYCTTKGRWKEPLKDDRFNAYFDDGSALWGVARKDTDMRNADEDVEIDAAMAPPK